MIEFTSLIKALSDPTAYQHQVEKVDVCQTHISAVFLAGAYAYKIKKPINLGFLDFTTLALRQHFCQEEVRLNRRLAPTVYKGVVPVTRSALGLHMEGDGEAVEWAVKMERLDRDSTLLARLSRDEVDVELIEKLARRVATFHARAEGSGRIASFGEFAVVARNARENFDQAASHVGVTLSSEVFERLRSLTEKTLAQLHPLIKMRAEHGVPKDTHGDLHLDHVYLFPDREPPSDLVVIDCIEFNERFRFADPVADMAFLVMDLRFQGRRDLGEAFADAYFRASMDEEGRALLPFYVAYRAAIRGKVEGIESSEKEVPDTKRHDALAKARGHWLLALGELEEPSKKPCLFLVAGLPGTGKSTLARSLVEAAGFSLIRSDLVRKELAGIAPMQSASAPFGEGIYSADWTEKTYAECLRQAEQSLFEGKRVIIDACFGEERKRHSFLDLAARMAVPVGFIRCQADSGVVHRRLRARRGDASDADWQIYLRTAETWEEPGSATRKVCEDVCTNGTQDLAKSQILNLLRRHTLMD